MEADIRDSKWTVIRAYLAKHFSPCLVEEDVDAQRPCRLIVRQGEMDLGTVHVSAALLADRHLSALELRWALKERDIASQLRLAGQVALDHAGLRIGDMSAIARWPRHQRPSPHSDRTPSRQGGRFRPSTGAMVLSGSSHSAASCGEGAGQHLPHLVEQSLLGEGFL